MSYAPYNNDDLTLKRFMVYSVILHIGMTATLLIGVYVQRSGNAWGGVGGGDSSETKVKLVSSAGIPMPQPNIFTIAMPSIPPRASTKPSLPSLLKSKP